MDSRQEKRRFRNTNFLKKVFIFFASTKQPYDKSDILTSHDIPVNYTTLGRKLAVITPVIAVKFTRGLSLDTFFFLLFFVAFFCSKNFKFGRQKWNQTDPIHAPSSNRGDIWYNTETYWPILHLFLIYPSFGRTFFILFEFCSFYFNTSLYEDSIHHYEYITYCVLRYLRFGPRGV
jgi:hypothetical protein